MEIWKPIKGYEGLYEISDHGRVKSFHRDKERILKPGATLFGHLHVILCKIDLRETCDIHVLVLEAFVGPRPFAYECDHIDGNPTNNYVYNLEWVTHKENVQRGASLIGQKGSQHPYAKLTDKEVLQIRDVSAKGNIYRIESLLKNIGCMNLQLVL